MNQKSLKYILLGLVTLIWGLIIYRVIKGLGEDDTKIFGNNVKKKIDYIAAPDSFVLLSNYPDPFLPADSITDTTTLTKDIGPTNNPSPIPSLSVTQPEPPKFDPSIIQYLGMISNPEKKIKVAIVSIAGKEYMASEKEKITDYLIKNITSNNIVISFKSKTYTISKLN